MYIKKVINNLIKYNITIASIESFTGGGFANTLTNIKGVSKIYRGSIIAYNNKEKIKLLNLDKSKIEKYTPYSKEVSLDMVKNGYNIFKTDIVISFSGYASKDQKNNINNLETFIWIKYKKSFIYINIKKKYMRRKQFKKYIIYKVLKKINFLIKKNNVSFYK